MPSLTPEHRREEVTSSALSDGYVNGLIAFVPSLGGLALAMKNPKFVKLTNWQSRTAIAIMPPLFVFAVTSEQKLTHRMHEVASESEHNMQTIAWAERKKTESAEDVRLRDLYRQSILSSGVRVVDTPQLTAFQASANFVQNNPFKLIAAIGIPAVAAVFRGQGGQTGEGAVKESFQMRLLHTRVFGQFAVICTLLSVMGLKEVMDRFGRYVTEDDIEARIKEMEETRTHLMTKGEYLKALQKHDTT